MRAVYLGILPSSPLLLLPSPSPPLLPVSVFIAHSFAKDGVLTFSNTDFCTFICRIAYLGNSQQVVAIQQFLSFAEDGVFLFSINTVLSHSFLSHSVLQLYEAFQGDVTQSHKYISYIGFTLFNSCTSYMQKKISRQTEVNVSYSEKSFFFKF